MFKNYYAVFAKRSLIGWFILQSVGPVEISAAQGPQIEIINGTTGTIAFSLVRTKRGSKYKELYIPDDSKQSKESKGFFESAKAAIVKLSDKAKRSLNVRIVQGAETTYLGRGGQFNIEKHSATVTNFPQKLKAGTKTFAYDRALWFVPIEKLGSLVKALSGQKITDSSVFAFEVGSALTAEIVDRKANGKLTLETTGKFLEGAKSIFNALTEEDENEWPNAEGDSMSLNTLTPGKVKKLEDDDAERVKAARSAANKAKQKEIAAKYGR